ncbi:cobalamin biosynthesis protein CobQ, partial [Chrysosporum ovalisporum ANA283AFssAo]|nr:cobalamin biosynthesis protein CobQ [Umezakia ovalisporum ANA283AFssAo]
MSSENLELTIGWLYPKLMSTYGDRGNVITIERRALWRGYNARVIAIDQKATAA